jgi:hypothetical protein
MMHIGHYRRHVQAARWLLLLLLLLPPMVSAQLQTVLQRPLLDSASSPTHLQL